MADKCPTCEYLAYLVRTSGVTKHREQSYAQVTRLLQDVADELRLAGHDVDSYKGMEDQ